MNITVMDINPWGWNLVEKRHGRRNLEWNSDEERGKSGKEATCEFYIHSVDTLREFKLYQPAWDEMNIPEVSFYLKKFLGTKSFQRNSLKGYFWWTSICLQKKTQKPTTAKGKSWARRKWVREIRTVIGKHRNYHHHHG